MSFFRSSLLSLILAAGLAAPALALDDVHKCDTFAAHPDDPNRWAAGVLDADIIPGPAVKFCEEAVEDYPDTARFLFQLGRSFWAAQRLEEGTGVFLTLEENFDYGPVYAYLGDAFYFGIGGVEADEEFAVQLYQVAADSGFAAAEEALASLNEVEVYEQDPVAQAPAGNETAQAVNQLANNQAAIMGGVAPAPAPTKIEFSSFSRPKLLRALEQGNLKAVDNMGMGNATIMGMKYNRLNVYLAGFNSQFSGSYNFKDPSCIALYNPRLAKRLERSAIATATGGGTTAGAAGATLNMFLGMTQQLQSGNMMGMVDQSQSIELLREEGVKDGAKLILGYGCQNPNVQRLYTNIVAKVTGGTPSLSPERAEEEKKERARRAEEAERQRIAAAKRKEEQRQKALRVSAQKSCEAQFKKPAFCGCLVEQFDTAGLIEDDWNSLGREFKAVVNLRDKYPDVPKILSSCRKTSSN